MSDKFDTRPTDFVRALDQTGWIRRAVRLPFRAPLAFRAAYGAIWSPGELVDISRTGVLFAPADLEMPDPDLRLVIFLSRAALEAGGLFVPVPNLYCGGPVTRTAKIPDGRQAVAIRFDHKWAARPSAAPAEIISTESTVNGLTGDPVTDHAWQLRPLALKKP